MTNILVDHQANMYLHKPSDKRKVPRSYNVQREERTWCTLPPDLHGNMLQRNIIYDDIEYPTFCTQCMHKAVCTRPSPLFIGPGNEDNQNSFLTTGLSF